MRAYIDIHVLQTLPPSNPNRDDLGSPKSATFGGVRRQRISSQAIKRAAREHFNERVDPRKVGVRTTRIVELLASRIAEKAPRLEDRSTELASMALKEIGFNLKSVKKTKDSEDAVERSEFLVFLSAAQLAHITEAVISVADSDESLDGIKKAFKELKPKKLVTADNSIDIALFGRMVAEPSGINVDASCMVAHAISVNAVASEYDYFTAVDDAKSQVDEEDAGAGMIGSLEFASSTLYRYATINVEQLEENLGSVEALDEAVSAFVDAFVQSMPTGKITTFANRTLPDAVLVTVRTEQPVNLVGAFEKPVVSDGEGHVKPAAERFRDHEKALREGSGFSPAAAFAGWTTPRAEAFGEIADRVTMADLGRRTVEALEALR